MSYRAPSRRQAPGTYSVPSSSVPWQKLEEMRTLVLPAGGQGTLRWEGPPPGKVWLIERAVGRNPSGFSAGGAPTWFLYAVHDAFVVDFDAQAVAITTPVQGDYKFPIYTNTPILMQATGTAGTRLTGIMYGWIADDDLSLEETIG